jgi:putative flippase GtrA
MNESETSTLVSVYGEQEADACEPAAAFSDQPDSCSGVAALCRRVIIDPTDSLTVQFLRYTVVGGCAFLVDFSVLVLLTSFVGLHYLISAALAFLAGSVTNYALSTAWVFHQRTFSDRRLEFLLFAGIGLVGLGLNEALMWLLTDGVGLHYMLSKLGATFLVYFWNFLARKFCLFR